MSVFVVGVRRFGKCEQVVVACVGNVLISLRYGFVESGTKLTGKWGHVVNVRFNYGFCLDEK